MHEISSEGGLWRYMMQSTRRMTQAAFSDFFQAHGTGGCLEVDETAHAVVHEVEACGDGARMDGLMVGGHARHQVVEPMLNSPKVPRPQISAVKRYVEEMLPFCDDLQRTVNRCGLWQPSLLPHDQVAFMGVAS